MNTMFVPDLIDKADKVEFDFIPPEGRPPLGTNVVLGLQHVLSMFGATVLGPLLMGFNPNTAIMFSGIATIIFYVIVGGRVPSYLGSSFSFIGVVVAATGYAGAGPNPNIGVALGGIFVAGLLYAVIGALVAIFGSRMLDWLFPPEVTGVIVGIIGLSLARTAAQQVGSNGVDLLIALATILIVCCTAIYSRSIIRRLPILIGALFGYGSYFLLHNVAKLGAPIDFTALNARPWLGWPEFRSPVFDVHAISLIAPIALVLVADNLGHIKAIGGMMHRNLDAYLGRAFLADGVATMISAFGGGTGVTTYAENMGVMRITRNFSSSTMLIAAVFAIFLGMSPKFGALIETVPTPVLGALSFIVFGLITATAGVIWQDAQNHKKVDFADTRTLIVVGIPLVMGAGNFSFSFGHYEFGCIVTATIMSVTLYHLLSFKRRRPTRPM